MRYLRSPELEQCLCQLATSAGLSHIDFSRIRCMVSQGSKSRRTLARCHSVPKIIQQSLELQSHYVIEVVSENFFKLSPDEQIKTLLHELLHIPKGFAGGFRYHDYATNKNVEKLFKQLDALPILSLPEREQSRKPPKHESIAEFLRRLSSS